MKMIKPTSSVIRERGLRMMSSSCLGVMREVLEKTDPSRTSFVFTRDGFHCQELALTGSNALGVQPSLAVMIMVWHSASCIPGFIMEITMKL